MPQPRLPRIVALLLLGWCATTSQAAEFTFQPADPASQGMSKETLDALRDDLAAHATKTFLVLRHDRVVYEWYAPDWNADKPHYTASMAKAAVGGLSAAVAMHDGRFKPNDPVSKFIPQWRDDPRKARITFMQLGTHSSGLDDAHDPVLPHDKLPGWKGEFWKQAPTDPFTLSRDTVPIIFEPGQRVSYSNPGIAMLTYAVTAAIQPGEQKDIRSLLRERVYGPIGMGAKEWSIGYGKTFTVDGLPLVGSWGGGSLTARAAARIGRLMLREGDWDGRRILDADVVRATVHPPGAPQGKRWEGDGSPSPGFGWWTNRDNAWPDVPRDTYFGAGAGDQLLIVIPSLDIVCVRNGGAIARTDEEKKNHFRAVQWHLLAPLAAAVVEKPSGEKAGVDTAPPPPPPPPHSSVIRDVRFDPDDAIVRKAVDSDNWPITWADDDHLYTSYGDGRGFEPFVKPKLSMGIARVEGNPNDFRGINVRSDTAERTGDGPKGPKASGMLMVDGILYTWVRNTGNATLTWSTDHGATWTWGFTLDTSFGCPAFLNFGRNYAGATDDYVYTFSQDSPSAYGPVDAVVLARAPKAKLREKAAYEFFAGSSASGDAVWSPDVAARKPVLHYPGHCERTDVIFNPGIGRYLMTMGFGHGKGWALFDAPKPWGPWTTAFLTTDWGQGETHGYRLPTKWISPDGREIWLIFSGRKPNDAFCLRRMTLDLFDKTP